MKFRKPLVDEFNSLFNIISTEGNVQVTRSNKDHGRVIEKWENARQVYLRGGATKEENFLVSGRLAHPSPIVRSNEIYNAMYDLVRNRPDIREYLKNLEVNQAKQDGNGYFSGHVNPNHIQDALGAIEYARGAKVASSHYSNSGIEQVAVDQLVAEQQVAAGNPLRQIDFENEAIRNVALRLLGQPALYTEAEQKYSTSHIAEISEAEAKDENIQGFYSRVLRECTHILGLSDQPEDSGDGGEPCDDGEEGVSEPTGGEGDDPDKEHKELDDEGEDEDEDEQESEGDGDEGDEDDEESEESESDDEGDEGDEDPDGEDEQDEDQGEEQKAPDKSPVDEILDELLDKVQESTPDVGVGDEEPADLTPADVEDQSERCQEEIDRVFNNQYQASEEIFNWVDNPYSLDDIAAPEDDGSSSRSFRGIPTHETWQLNQGKVNVFNSQMETDPSKLLVLVDCSGSTHDNWGSKGNPRGFRSTQQVMWTLAGTMLKTSPNSVAYGFCGSQQYISIYPGLKSGTYPKGEWYRGEGNVGGGGTPTSQALHWASLKSGGSDDVIVLITDGMPGISAPTMVRRLADSGATIAVIVVPNAHSSVARGGGVARRFGSEISGVYDPRSPESEDSIQQLMANLIV